MGSRVKSPRSQQRRLRKSPGRPREVDRRPGAGRRCEAGGKEHVSRVRKPAITFSAAESSAVTPGVGFGFGETSASIRTYVTLM